MEYTNEAPKIIGGDQAMEHFEFPKLMYRPAEIVTHPETGLATNVFHGHPCHVTPALSADHAEELALEGWDLSPAAAHGEQVGLIAATTAKDDEIAALRAELAAMRSDDDKPRRGRPPKTEELHKLTEPLPAQ